MPTQAKDIFEAQSKSVRELLSDNGLGLYLPPYQRPYSWEKVKVLKLLDDTLHGLKNLSDASDSFTFLGSVITIHDVNHVTVQPIVKPEVPSKVLTVIDGQQRLSSLLLLLVQLHNQIRQLCWKVFKGKQPDSSDAAKLALYSETINLLQMLGMAFYERKNFGDAPVYPRLIRAFDDQWSKNANDKRYESPIAHLIYDYAVLADTEDAASKPTNFLPKPRLEAGDGEEDLVKRFGEIRTNLLKLVRLKVLEELEDLPSLSVLATGIDLQRSLFNHELDSELCALLKTLDKSVEADAQLSRLIMFGAYALNRIALTVVQGKDEDYAFTIFESLNTTGEPLTAFETFLPRVVMAEDIADYKDSEAHEHMKAIQLYLSRFGAGDALQKATKDLLVSFALAETGKKLSKRLPDQRAYMKDTFDFYKNNRSGRNLYLSHLSATAMFTGMTWDPKSETRVLKGLPPTALTDTVKLCLSFLYALNHSIAIAPLVRFYFEAILADDKERDARIKDFESAVKAITAFTVLWRATRRGTGNIDSEYRAVMLGDDNLTGMGPLARTRAKPKSNHIRSVPAVDADALKRELSARLCHKDHGEVVNLVTFLQRAGSLPLYAISRPLTRFLLLSAYHDTIEDSSRPGLIVAGKVGTSPCFTSNGWDDDTHLTIEHIAPQHKTGDWVDGLYSDKETVHRLGNLVLAPQAANASLSSRPWKEKKVLYSALGAPSAVDAKFILEDCGLEFNQSTEEIASMSSYLPHLSALGKRSEDWDVDFIDDRSEVLLRLVYARLKEWLGLELSDKNTDAVTALERTQSTDEDEEYLDDDSD